MREVLTLARLRAMTPDEAAALWMVREDDGPGDAGLFEAWLADRPANVLAWDKAQGLWESFDHAPEDEMVEAMRRSALALGPAAARQPWRRLAAGVAIALGSGAILLGVLAQRSERGPQVATTGPAPQVAATDLSTARGQRSVTELPDGSRLTLDTNSAVRVAFAGSRRRVQVLRGQAFFDVVHDPERPFSVEMRDLVVTDLGTRFDARLDPDAASVILVEGRVSISRVVTAAAGPAVELKAGERFTAHLTGPDRVTRADPGEATNWQSGYVEFRNQTLGAAAAELNRYSRIQIVIHDPKVAALRISGRFATGDVARFCRTVAIVQPVRAIPRGPDAIELVAAHR
jgi:transmembrane sensor